MHCWELFYSNSLMRRDLVNFVSLDALLDVYNRRLERRWEPRVTGSLDDAIIFVGSVARMPELPHPWEFQDRWGGERVRHLQNYVPSFVRRRSEFQQYAYLETPDFERFAGIPYEAFRDVWRGLNPESIADSCHDLLARRNSASCPSREECRAVVDFLTYRRFDGDVRVVSS